MRRPSISPRFLLAIAQRAMLSAFELRFELGECARLCGNTLAGTGEPLPSCTAPKGRSARLAPGKTAKVKVTFDDTNKAP
jgi:hypothetical protein